MRCHGSLNSWHSSSPAFQPNDVTSHPDKVRCSLKRLSTRYWLLAAGIFPRVDWRGSNLRTVQDMPAVTCCSHKAPGHHTQQVVAAKASMYSYVISASWRLSYQSLQLEGFAGPRSHTPTHTQTERKRERGREREIDTDRDKQTRVRGGLQRMDLMTGLEERSTG